MSPEFKIKFKKAYLAKYAQATPPAFSRGWLPFIGASMALGAIMRGMDVFIDKVLEHLNSIKGQKLSKEYFKKMLEKHPTLLKEDPEVVAKYWDSLYHFAPQMAQEPLAAGAYIRQSIDKGLEEVGGPSADIVKHLTDIQDKSLKSQQAAAPTRQFMVSDQDLVTRTVGNMVQQDMRNNPAG